MFINVCYCYTFTKQTIYSLSEKRKEKKRKQVPFSSAMVFYRHEEQPNPSKRCKFLAATFKDAFSNCHSPYNEESSPDQSKRRKFLLTSTLKDAFSDCSAFRGKPSFSYPEEESPTGDFDDEQEVFVSAVISKYMESKEKRKSSLAGDSFCWAFSPRRDLCMTPKGMEGKGGNQQDEAREEIFFTPRSRLSRSTSLSSMDAFASAKTTFSRCSSMSRIDFPDYRRRRLIIQELRHCEGWPFGLCKRVLLLPPLPKSPSDSWSWRKSTRLVKGY